MKIDDVYICKNSNIEVRICKIVPVFINNEIIETLIYYTDGKEEIHASDFIFKNNFKRKILNV